MDVVKVPELAKKIYIYINNNKIGCGLNLLKWPGIATNSEPSTPDSMTAASC
jgi:hypothetical protein